MTTKGVADEGLESGRRRGAIHAVELRDGQAVSYLRRNPKPMQASSGTPVLCWLSPKSGCRPATPGFSSPRIRGGLTVPIASHVHRVAADGARVLFAVDDGVGGSRSGEDDGPRHVPAHRGMGRARWRSVRPSPSSLERATWQHDIGVTAEHVVFIESPTTRLAGRRHAARCRSDGFPVARDGSGVVRARRVRGDGRSGGFRLDPCLVTHVLGAYEEGGTVLPRAAPSMPSCCTSAAMRLPNRDSASTCRPRSSVLTGIGFSTIGGGLAVLERWRITGDGRRAGAGGRASRRVSHASTRRHEGEAFRYGYCVEMAWGDVTRDAQRSPSPGGPDVAADPAGLLKFDLHMTTSRPGDPDRDARPANPSSSGRRTATATTRAGS